jgi:hypothetical protein
MAASPAGGKIFSTANGVEKSEGRSLWRKDLRRQLVKLGWQIAARDTELGTTGGHVRTVRNQAVLAAPPVGADLPV